MFRASCPQGLRPGLITLQAYGLNWLYTKYFKPIVLRHTPIVHMPRASGAILLYLPTRSGRRPVRQLAQAVSPGLIMGYTNSHGLEFLIQRSIHNRLLHMSFINMLSTVKICDRTGYFQNFMISTHAQV